MLQTGKEKNYITHHKIWLMNMHEKLQQERTKTNHIYELCD